MAITLVQSAAATGASTAPACAFAVSSTAGNLIIAKVAWLTSGGTLTLPAGYTQDVALTGSNPLVAIWSRPNAGATSLVNALLSGSAVRWIMALEEWSGILGAAPLDRTATAAGTGTAAATGTTAATAQAEELAAAAIAGDDGTYGDGEFSAPTNGFTLLENRANGNPLVLATLYKALSASAAQSTGATVSTSVGYTGVIATYKAPISMSYSANYSAGEVASFQHKVRQALALQALVVVAEDPTTANHFRRAQYAVQVLRFSADTTVDPIAQAVASDGATSDASPDADILARVAAVWDGLSGVV